jgi:hypothetical protein
MELTDVQPHKPSIPDAKRDTSRDLTSHLQNQDADTLVTAAWLGINTLLRDLRESGLFCKDEIDEMLAADTKTVTVSKDQLILKWVKIGPTASEIRQFTINHVDVQ